MHRLMLRDLSYEAHLGPKTKTENRPIFPDPVKKFKIAPKAQPGLVLMDAGRPATGNQQSCPLMRLDSQAFNEIEHSKYKM